MNELYSRGYEGAGPDIAPQHAGVQEDSPVCTIPHIPLNIARCRSCRKIITEVSTDVVIH